HHHHSYHRVHEHPHAPIHAAARLHAVEGAADRPADRSHDHGDDQGDEHGKHRCQVEKLLHLGRVLVVEPEYDQQRAEKEDLGHQGLDYAALVTGDECDHQDQDDEDVDDHRSGAILDDGHPNSFLSGLLVRSAQA